MPARNFGVGILVGPSIVKGGYWCARGIGAPLREGKKRTQAIPKVPAL
jgi:hypothetical protein